MNFNEVREEMKGIFFKSLREDTNEYFEAVAVKEEMPRLKEKLEKFFGAPVWPSQKEIPTRIEEAIAEYGGILPGQELYFLDKDNEVMFAMLWPWNDGKHATVKIIKK